MAGLIAPVARLIEEFSRLPGVGTKTAQRLTYHMLRAPASEARDLADALVAIKERVAYCSVCSNITETGVDPCEICADDRRDATRICVVEEPADLIAVEKSQEYRGLYHVIHGTISPLDGIGPDALRIKELLERLRFPRALGVRRQEPGEFLQHREQRGGPTGPCPHGGAVLAQEQRLRNLAGVIGVFPDPEALRVGAAESVGHRRAERIRVNGPAGFEHGQDEPGGAENRIRAIGRREGRSLRG